MQKGIHHRLPVDCRAWSDYGRGPSNGRPPPHSYRQRTMPAWCRPDRTYVQRMGLNSRLMQTNGLQTKYLSNVQNPWLIQLKHRNLVPEDSNMFAVTEQIPAFRTWMHNPRPGSGPERVLSGPPSRLKNTGNFSWSTEILWMNLNFIELLASFQLIKSETARMAIILNHKHYKG